MKIVQHTTIMSLLEYDVCTWDFERKLWKVVHEKETFPFRAQAEKRQLALMQTEHHDRVIKNMDIHPTWVTK